MDEFRKARLRLFGIFLIFVLAVIALVSGVVSSCKKIFSAPQSANTVLEEPYFETSVKTEKKTQKKTQENISERKAPLDRSSAFHGIMPAWKKYRRPKCGILADVTNNKILWSYNADKSVPIASMSKMMTLSVAHEAMSGTNGILNLKSPVKISKNSATGREGGFGFMPGDVYTIGELMQAATVRSCNDAAGALAVYFGGTEENFVLQMNEKAQQLGMTKTHFINPHGLPQKEKDNLSTMNDMLILSMLMLENPDYMSWTKLNGVKIGQKVIVNTNNLMRKRKYPGVDGLKTGYTKRAGFCLAFSCIRDGRRLVGVVAGFPSAADRENFVTALLNWAYKK